VANILCLAEPIRAAEIGSNHALDWFLSRSDIVLSGTKGNAPA